MHDYGEKDKFRRLNMRVIGDGNRYFILNGIVYKTYIP